MVHAEREADEHEAAHLADAGKGRPQKRLHRLARILRDEVRGAREVVDGALHGLVDGRLLELREDFVGELHEGPQHL